MFKAAVVGFNKEHLNSIYCIPDVSIRFLCDQPSERGLALLSKEDQALVSVFQDERELYNAHCFDIDILVIATSKYRHAESLLLWGCVEGLIIFVDAPVAISETQVEALITRRNELKANIWVGMEYRYSAPIQMLRRELAAVGKVRQINVRTFSLNKNEFIDKYFDMFFMFGGDTEVVRCETDGDILVELSNGVMCCLEIVKEGCNLEEITIAGDKEWLEGYLHEMVVYKYTRTDKTMPKIYQLGSTTIQEAHSNYRQWLHLLEQIRTDNFVPAVSLEDGIRSVQCGLMIH